MEKYRFTFKNEKIKFYNRISTIAILINALIFFSFCFSFKASKEIIIITAAAALIIITGLLLIAKYYPANKKWGVGYIILFDIIVVTWILLENYWIAVLHLVLSFLSSFAVKKNGAIFYPEKIVIYSLARNDINWGQLTNVVLKDGLLTIDLKNNKIIQQLIEENVNEKEFNDFCRQQLNK